MYYLISLELISNRRSTLRRDVYVLTNKTRVGDLCLSTCSTQLNDVLATLRDNGLVKGKSVDRNFFYHYCL